MTSNVRLAALNRELGGKPEADLDALSGAEIGALVESLRSARRNQQEHLQRAFDAALQHVPLLLRGAVRKILQP